MKKVRHDDKSIRKARAASLRERINELISRPTGQRLKMKVIPLKESSSSEKKPVGAPKRESPREFIEKKGCVNLIKTSEDKEGKPSPNSILRV